MWLAMRLVNTILFTNTSAVSLSALVSGGGEKE